MSVCHCLSCQRRTGGPFAAQARFPVACVVIAGEYRIWEKTADSGRKAWFRWCPDCGATVAYVNEGMDGVIAVPVGAFADPDFPAPGFSIYEARKADWVAISGPSIRHED